MTEVTLDQALQQAVAHHRAGQLPEAEKLYRAILQAQPGHPDANHNLGVLAVNVNQSTAALPFFKAALEANPAHAQYWLSYIDALIRAGQPDAARQVIALARQRGLSEEKLRPLEEQFSAKPDRAEQERLVDLYNQQRFPEMEILARELIRRFPAHPFGWETLPSALKKQKRYAEANVAYRQALQLAPHSAMTLSNFADCLNKEGLYQEALQYAVRATELNPGFGGAWVNRANALLFLEKHTEAAECSRWALQCAPELPEAHNNLGTALHEMQGADAEAEAHFRRALEIRPEYPKALENLATLLAGQGLVGEAENHFRKALCLQPDFITICREKLLLPKIPPSCDSITHWRQRYQQGIETLMALPDTLDDPAKKLSTGAFDLAYHDADDRPVMEALRRLFRAKAPALDFTAAHVAGWQAPAGRRIRVGFLSNFLVGHTIGKLYQGFVRHLDRARFEVVLLHAPRAKRDAFSAELDKLAKRSLTLPATLAAQQQAVAGLELDVLFYPDIGMSPDTYFLAYARLAPVQALSWGHPDTSGLDTLDYFVSADCIEPEGADAHYSERLIRMNSLPCFYQALVAPTQIPSRTTLGLPERGTLYGCPQSLFKFHPEFDAVLAQIAAGDPDGHIVLVEGKVPTWTRLLRERWAQSAPILNERVVFLPRQPLNLFMALMAHFDVLLDPIHFGSGNTLYEAMVYGKPIVTWPGRFMRGRIVAGAYRQMCIADAPIARRLEDYAPLALALGRDEARRTALREALAQGARKLFADLRAVREFEAFLEAAVAAAGRGEKLPPGWHPEMSGANR
jgi:predicted O-linked N-acetylglucosamine transferase (SPINDLY family)